MKEHPLRAYGFDPDCHDFEPGQAIARVISVHRTMCLVTNGSVIQKATLAGKLTYERSSPLDFPIVGDYVVIGNQNDTWMITDVLKRKSMLSRKTAGGESDSQGIAANIDIIFIVVDVNHIMNAYVLERYLAITSKAGAKPVIIISKSDLADTQEPIMAHISAIARNVTVLFSSDQLPPFYDEVNEILEAGQTYVFIGPSGSGKSTMVNHLFNQNIQNTGMISKDGEGRHTTTSSTLMVTKHGAIIIDTPGMREVLLDSADLDETFSDIKILSAQCRFRDCTHKHEPGCKVKEAIDDGILPYERLERYHRLERELANQIKRAQAKQRILTRRKA